MDFRFTNQQIQAESTSEIVAGADTAAAGEDTAAAGEDTAARAADAAAKGVKQEALNGDERRLLYANDKSYY